VLVTKQEYYDQALATGKAIEPAIRKDEREATLKRVVGRYYYGHTEKSALPDIEINSRILIIPEKDYQQIQQGQWPEE